MPLYGLIVLGGIADPFVPSGPLLAGFLLASATKLAGACTPV
jgi:hypothetical protein